MSLLCGMGALTHLAPPPAGGLDGWSEHGQGPPSCDGSRPPRRWRAREEFGLVLELELRIDVMAAETVAAPRIDAVAVARDQRDALR